MTIPIILSLHHQRAVLSCTFLVSNIRRDPPYPQPFHGCTFVLASRHSTHPELRMPIIMVPLVARNIYVRETGQPAVRVNRIHIIQSIRPLAHEAQSLQICSSIAKGPDDSCRIYAANVVSRIYVANVVSNVQRAQERCSPRPQNVLRDNIEASIGVEGGARDLMYGTNFAQPAKSRKGQQLLHRALILHLIIHHHHHSLYPRLS